MEIFNVELEQTVDQDQKSDAVNEETADAGKQYINESERKQAEGRHFASNNTNLDFIFIQEALSYQEDKSMDDIPPMAILEKTAKTADDGKY